MKLKSSKTTVFVFTMKTNVLLYTYKQWDPSITRKYSIKDLGLQLDLKLHM